MIGPTFSKQPKVTSLQAEPCARCGNVHGDVRGCAFPPDNVNHPDHYQSASGLECIDAIRAALTPEEFRGYCKGAALKYIWREGKKGGNESLAKSVWYMNEAQK